MQKTNILKPPNDKTFPYWPALGIQDFHAIPGAQIAGEVQDIDINKSMYMMGYPTGDVKRLATPQTTQDASGAAQFIEGTPVMGRGAGVGLTDMLLMSIAQQTNQTKGESNE